MRYFHSICHFFKKCRNWRLAQMTPVFTFVELPAPSREDPSTLKVNFLVKIANFARNGFFFNVFRDSHFQSQLFGQMKRFLWIYNFWKSGKIRDSVRGRGFKCFGRLEKREKTQFREKVANLTLKCTFDGSKVLTGGGQTLENRKNLCHFIKPPISALCEKWYIDTKCRTWPKTWL